MPKTPTIYISRHENGGILQGTIYWLFFKKIAGCRRAKHVTYSKLCNIFPEWIDMSTYICWPSMPDAENPNNLYFKTWKWGYTQGTIYWLFFKEIAGCKRAKPVTYSKLCNIFSRMDGYEYLYMWPSMPDAENPNNLYFKGMEMAGYTAGYHILVIFQRNCRM